MGAMIGATPITSISFAIRRIAPRSSATSRTMARAITMPVQPPSACSNRAAIRLSILGASAQASEATV
jgi:hypothetical protein